MYIPHTIHIITPWLQAIGITLSLTLGSLICGFIVALIFTVAQLRRKSYWQWPLRAWVFVIRGTPLLLQIFLIYFGVAQFNSISHSYLWWIFKEPFNCALLALTINTSAYGSRLLLGALQAIPLGEYEACDALGLTRSAAYRHILLPRALGIVLPAYSNEAIMILKGSSLVSTITLLDLMGLTRDMITHTYAAIGYLSLAGLLYLLMNAGIMYGFHLAERRYTTINIAAY